LFSTEKDPAISGDDMDVQGLFEVLEKINLMSKERVEEMRGFVIEPKLHEERLRSSARGEKPFSRILARKNSW